MGKFEFTEEQKDAIKTIDRSVLVTAAAGSGKTAVLTGRCAYLVCDAHLGKYVFFKSKLFQNLEHFRFVGYLAYNGVLAAYIYTTPRGTFNTLPFSKVPFKKYPP